MYAKLAFRNIRRSLRDYIIYFVTLTLTAALMYSFLALGLSPDILAMTENMSMLTTGILILSALIAFMSSFVIGYAVRFMLGQRKKEFAAYELMGILSVILFEKQDLSEVIRQYENRPEEKPHLPYWPSLFDKMDF